MELIIDANILFSALIKESLTSEIIVNSDLFLYSPEYIFEEFSKYEKIILEKTKRTKEELYRILDIFQDKINLIPLEDFKKYITQAKSFCPDTKDVAYFALSLKLKIPIWTNDKKLKEQNIIQILNTQEILKLLFD